MVRIILSFCYCLFYVCVGGGEVGRVVIFQ